jgi:hypothetical protein
MPKGGVLAIEQSQDESRFVGVRAALNVTATYRFANSLLKTLWQSVGRRLTTFAKTQRLDLLITPAFEMSMPKSLLTDHQMVGNRELMRWTQVCRTAIMEKRVRHDGSSLLASTLRTRGSGQKSGCVIFVVAPITRPDRVGAMLSVCRQHMVTNLRHW